MSNKSLSEYATLASKSMLDIEPADFKALVIKMREDYLKAEAERKAAKATKSASPVEGISFRWTKTGKPSLIVRRKPAWISTSEIEKLHAHYGVPSNVLWKLVREREIEVSETKIQLKGL